MNKKSILNFIKSALNPDCSANTETQEPKNFNEKIIKRLCRYFIEICDNNNLSEERVASLTNLSKENINDILNYRTESISAIDLMNSLETLYSKVLGISEERMTVVRDGFLNTKGLSDNSRPSS